MAVYQYRGDGYQDSNVGEIAILQVSVDSQSLKDGLSQEEVKTLSNSGNVYILPAPNIVKDTFDQQWSEYSKTADILALAGEAADKAGQMNKFIGGAMALGRSTREVTRTTLSQGGSNLSIDPESRMRFEGGSFRQFRFHWDLYPESEVESNEIEELILSLKKESAGNRTKVASIGASIDNASFNVRFTNEKFDRLMNMKECVITSIEMDLTPGGFENNFSNGMPKHIALGVSFSDYTIKYAEDWK